MPVRSQASHDETIFLSAKTLWSSIGATTSETLPKVIQSILADSIDDSETQSLRNLADILGTSSDVDQWTAIFTGLGLATLERHVASFISILDRHAVQRAHWSLASSYADPSLEIPDLTASDQWKRLRSAVLDFRRLPKHDLRADCLALLPAESVPPRSVGIAQTNRLLSCLAPICGGDSISLELQYEPDTDRDPDVREIARLLSTAYLVDPDLAQNLVESLGGERGLCNLFHSQIPWTTPPIIESASKHGRTIRSNWHQIAEQHQSDPHEAVCEICETLIALSPLSNAAASDVVDPAGQTITVGDYKPWSKNIPRANLPPKARVAWNVAFRQVLLASSAAYSLTDYTNQMAPLVRRTEKVFRSFTEKWIKKKRISNANALASEINSILDAVSAVAYAAPERTPSTMTEPFRAGADDTLGALLTGVLGNLIGRLSKLETAKATATFAGSLGGQAREHHQFGIWRTMSAPPLKELAKLSERLVDVSCILHEMAHDSGPDAIQRIVKTTRKAGLGTAVRAAARHCRHLSDRRFENRLRELETALGGRGWKVRCVSRPINEHDSPYWPAREVAILLEIENLAEQWIPNVEDLLSLGKKHLENDWPFRTVPVMKGQILASLALVPSSHMPLPDHNFAREWSDFVDRLLHSSVLLDKFDAAVDACMQISAIIKCRGTKDLHPEEDEVLARAVTTFKSNHETLRNAADRTKAELFALALDSLDRNWKRLLEEFEAVKAGRSVDDPLCTTPYLAMAGKPSEQSVELAALRLAILQAEFDTAGVGCVRE